MTKSMTIAKKGVDYGSSLGADQTEVTIVNEKLTRIEMQKSSLKGGDIFEAGGVGVRVYVGKSLGLASITRISDLNDAVKKAYSLARGSLDDPYFNSLPESGKYRSIRGLYDKELAAASYETLTKMMIDGIKEAATSPDFTVSGELNKSVYERIIVNSLGVEAKTRGTRLSGSIQVKYERGTDASFGFEPIYGRSLKEFNSITAGQKAAKKARERIGAKMVSSGTIDVVLEHRSTLESLASLINLGANGLAVVLGTAFLAGKIGEDVAAKSLTMVDDPFAGGGVASRSFDDEGSPTEKIVLIEKGEFKNYLTDSYSAYRLGVKNNGHGSRNSLISKPTPSISNLIISAGSWGMYEIIKETKKGILIEDSGLTPQGESTNISSMVDYGYYIENGEIKHPIKNTMVGLAVFDVLTNIDAISRETLNLWGSRTPSIRISKVKVSSE